MKIQDMTWHRLFSKTLYKNLKFPQWEMTFTKDFVTDTRGDMYPILHKSDDCCESVCSNRYRVTSGEVSRMAGAFFPYATYELTFSVASGSCGLSFVLPDATASLTCSRTEICFTCAETTKSVPRQSEDEVTMIVSCRPSAFDVYFPINGQPILFHTFTSDAFETSDLFKRFNSGYVSLCVQGEVTVADLRSYIDCGLSQADIRPIRYENGDVMMENGKIYLCLTIRMQWEKFQGVVAWTPGTSEFTLTGALFFDSGDGQWGGDVGASILYHRPTQEWYLWVVSFSHDHVLGHSVFKGDPRFGVNVIDITLMEKASEGAPITEFLGFVGDEDPDFYYDAKTQTWYMSVCRLDPAIGAYKYMFFKSDKPFEGYTCIGHGLDGAETGGSFVTVGDEKIFACGNSFNLRANYRIYTKDGMIEPTFDFDDGGFRGWGTIIPVEMGSRRRYFWLTFDRHNASDYNWSYGNIYCFEGIL